MKPSLLCAMMTFVGVTFSQSQHSTSSQMKKLLKDISIKAIELGDYNTELTDEQLDSVWIGYAPATRNDIEAAEKRLGVTLPKNYVDFLLITNGFHAATGIEPGLCAVNNIDFLKNVDPELYEIWIETGNTEVGKRLKTAIKVGGFDEEQYFFLIPPDKKHSTWEYWVFASWIPGEIIYESMTDYFQEVLETTAMSIEEKKRSNNTE